ncbi:sigma-54-dependent Fis family transcriptional regulator [Rhodopseudomonas palustris]|uniref:Sigma54 specific transcriptional regulator with GAF sensor, Fis family n=1 Tax=Rhodopseudomonas palustris (strain BisB18) TaxID=316056 RepID=Q210P4_RHOPB
MEQRTIRIAWEKFVAHGRLSTGVPAAVLASWARSKSFGVGAGVAAAPLAGEPELFRRRTTSSDLLGAARPALERSARLLADAGSMMILTDASGFIVETGGDPRVVDAGRSNHLEPGGRWEENAIGTNAIGTALADGRPTLIRGSEHFCEDVQRWTCAAVPVRHPIGGDLLGVVDISGPAGTFSAQDFALAAAIGQEIEASLGSAARQEHEALLKRFLSKRSIWLSEEILVIDRRGVLVHATDPATNKLDAANPNTLAQDIRQMIAGASQDAWQENCRRRFPNARLEIVSNADTAVGCLIVMHRSRRAAPAPAAGKPSQESNVDFDQIIGDSVAMRDARSRARKLAMNALPILVEGETGVGKELFARAIKGAGPGADGPFVPLNCGGMPRDLIASELFGYVKGAFTGADEGGRAGKIERADGGVLCLDEIGEMPLDLQSYLLRVLEDGIVYRVGDHVGRRVNVRIISMTNRDLTAEIEAGRFRRDLYYRIAAARILVPPLRERGDDVIALAQRFAAAAALRLRQPAPSFSPELLARLQAHDWPGNVRELRNVIDAMVALAESERLDLADWPAEFPRDTRLRGQAAAAMKPTQPPRPSESLQSAERAAILAQVAACNGNLTQAAKRLGIARSTLYLRLTQYRRDESSTD